MNRLKWKKKQKSKSKIKFSKGGDERSYPASEVRGCGREDIPHTPRPKAVARVPASLPIRPPREEGTAGVPCGSGRQGRASRWPRTAHPISLAPASP